MDVLCTVYDVDTADEDGDEESHLNRARKKFYAMPANVFPGFFTCIQLHVGCLNVE